MSSDIMHFKELLAVGAEIPRAFANNGTVTCGTFFRYSNTCSQENLARPKLPIFAKSFESRSLIASAGAYISFLSENH
jgi:hypothetical protein